MIQELQKNFQLFYKRPRLRIGLYVTMLCVLVFFLYRIDGSVSLQEYKHIINPEFIEQIIRDAGTWSWLVYVAIISIMVMGPLPSSIVVLIGGYFFHPIVTIVLTAIGESIGATGNFFIGRSFGKKIIMEHVPKIKKLINTYGYHINRKTILFLSIFPVGTSNITGYLAGMSGVRYRDYAISWVCGVTTLNTVLALLGYSARAQQQILTLSLVVCAGGLLWFIYRKFKKG